MSEGNLLVIKNLTVSVKKEEGERVTVRDVSFQMQPQTVVGLVGGSGSGKTTLGLAIMGLLMPPLVLQRGEIIFEQENLISLSQSRLQNIRGKRIGMVFQEPLNAFNPVFTIGSQISEVLKIHLSLSPAVRQSRVLELLDLVGLQDPRRVERSYPHQLSGGMRQRAMIAQAIAADPALLIADEPTSNLDVTLQAKVMELFEDLRQKLKLSIFLISHDLGMVKHIASDLIVMKSGEIVEQGTTLQVTSSPRGEYTRQLLQAFR